MFSLAESQVRILEHRCMIRWREHSSDARLLLLATSHDGVCVAEIVDEVEILPERSS